MYCYLAVAEGAHATLAGGPFVYEHSRTHQVLASAYGVLGMGTQRGTHESSRRFAQLSFLGIVAGAMYTFAESFDSVQPGIGMWCESTSRPQLYAQTHRPATTKHEPMNIF